MTKLVIIVPCFNEEDVIEDSFSQMNALLVDMISDGLIHKNSKLCFVDDGSKDKT